MAFRNIFWLCKSLKNNSVFSLGHTGFTRVTDTTRFFSNGFLLLLVYTATRYFSFFVLSGD